jgi:hypothetical protein
MADEAGSIGARLDLNVRAGDTLGPFTAALTDSSGAAIDLTNFTFEGAVSRLQTDDVAVAMTCTIDAAAGEVEFKVAAASTGALADDDSDFFRASQTYSWYLKGTDSIGNKQTYLYGYVRVAKELPT